MVQCQVFALSLGLTVTPLVFLCFQVSTAPVFPRPRAKLWAWSGTTMR